MYRPWRDVKDEDDDDDAGEEKGEPTEDDDGDGNNDEMEGSRNSESNLLSDFQYKLDQALRSQTRGLLVKDLMIAFDGDSVYGKRAGFHKALMLTATQPNLWPWPWLCIVQQYPSQPQLLSFQNPTFWVYNQDRFLDVTCIQPLLWVSQTCFSTSISTVDKSCLLWIPAETHTNNTLKR